ncbi:MAG TPA: TatD family hydrolase [Anaerolineae bacterium]|nr:TatD family hydrolase [Anaerolineae bacterium]
MFVDTHCHLDWNAFDADRDAVIRRAIDGGVTRLLTIGVDVPSSRRAIELAEQYAGVYAAVGVHPNDCADFDTPMLQEVRSLAQHPKVVAIGEIGLDYYWHKVDHDVQARAFQAQLELAAELGKPVIVHSREAAGDTIEMLENFTRHSSLITGALHSYFDDLAIMQRAFAIGFFCGVTGPITFKKSDRERDIIRQAPLDRLLIETDAPFLTPVPHRGQRNEPAYVRHVAETIAQVQGLTVDVVAQHTTLNANQLLGW